MQQTYEHSKCSSVLTSPGGGPEVFIVLFFHLFCGPENFQNQKCFEEVEGSVAIVWLRKTPTSVPSLSRDPPEDLQASVVCVVCDKKETAE